MSLAAAAAVKTVVMQQRSAAAIKGDAEAKGIQVYVRIRPPPQGDPSSCITSSSTSLKVSSAKQDVSCSFDHVFGESSSQADVFARVQPLLAGVLKGINASILAYGQTNAGKSHTMLGPAGGTSLLRGAGAAGQWGVLPRAATFLLGALAELADDGLCTYTVKASMLQIYNEGLVDLLAPSGALPGPGPLSHAAGAAGAASNAVAGAAGTAANSVAGAAAGPGAWDDSRGAHLRIREVPTLLDQQQQQQQHSALYSPSGPQEVYVSGLSEYRVQTAKDVLRLLARGMRVRVTEATDGNATSSRSHAVLQLSFEIALTGAGAGAGAGTGAGLGAGAGAGAALAELHALYSSRGGGVLKAKLSLGNALVLSPSPSFSPSFSFSFFFSPLPSPLSSIPLSPSISPFLPL